MSKIDDDNNKSDLQETDEKMKNAGNKAKNAAKDTGKKAAKKVLKNKKVMAFIVAHLPLIIGIVVAIIVLILAIGIIIFLSTMPGLILGKLDELSGNVWANISSIFTGDETTAKITKKQVIDLAQYLQNMGYDIETYGLGEVTYKDDGKTSYNRNGENKQIEKIGESVDGKNYLEAYLAADENTYTLAQFNILGTLKAATDSIFNNNTDSAVITDAKSSSITDESKKYSTGMINILGYDEGILKESNESFVRIDRSSRQMQVYTKAFKLNDIHLAMLTGGTSLITAGVKKAFTDSSAVQWGEVFTYDLNDWLARYGRPKELLLAIHLSTMMPDLAYTIATDDKFDTKVNLGIEDITVTYGVNVTRADETLDTDKIVDLFLENCLGTGDVKVKEETKKVTVTTQNPNGTTTSTTKTVKTGNYTDDEVNDDCEDNGEYEKLLDSMDEKTRKKFFKQVWDQIQAGATRQFTNFWGINFLKASDKANGESGVWSSIAGAISKIDIFDLFSKDSNTYIYLNSGDEKISGTNWTYNEIIGLAELAYKGNLGGPVSDMPYTDDPSGITDTEGNIDSGISNVKWPFIRSVEKHWYYNAIDFTKNSYRFAKTATKTIDYKPQDEKDTLNKDDMTIKLNATFQSNQGVIYQVCEPEPTGPNDNIKNVFTQKYYMYDGTPDTAKKISNAKAIEAGKSSYKFNGQEYSVDYSEDMIEQKKNVHFEKDKANTLMAFSILENVHTEAADYIYRNLKELVVQLGYFNKSELTSDLKKIMLWPIKTDYQYNTWETTKDENKFGSVIECNEGETTVVCPANATVKEINGDTITLELTDIDDETANLYNYIYNRNSQQGMEFTNINKEILKGLILTIKGVNINSSISTNSNISRGDVIGQATGKTNGKTSITITMQNPDKTVIDGFDKDDEDKKDGSVIDNLSEYFDQTHNTKYEEIMKKQMESKENKTGIDIANYGAQSSSYKNLFPDLSDVENNIDGLKVTSSTISREEFISRTQAYAKKYGERKTGGFAANAGTIYDVCIKNGINPVWAAAQARNEGSWGPVRNKKNNFWSMGAINENSNAGEEYDTVEAATQRYCNNVKRRLKGEIGALARSKELQPYDSKHFHGAIVSLCDVFSNYAIPDNPAGKNSKKPIPPTLLVEHTVNYISEITKITRNIYGEYGINS